MQPLLEDPRYPIGRYPPPAAITPPLRDEWIERIAGVPAALRRAVSGLSAEQLDTPYREGGWRVRQVVHHLPDSHMNAYTRFKLALTEDAPLIKPYDEAGWADLGDTDATPIEVSLALLESLHRRWVILLRSLQDAQWSRTFTHPETGPWPLEKALSLYAWHGDHHVAHIVSLRNRMGW